MNTGRLDAVIEEYAKMNLQVKTLYVSPHSWADLMCEYGARLRFEGAFILHRDARICPRGGVPNDVVAIGEAR
jgi:hypothetical protein